MSRLAKDKLVVPGVSWACLSFVGNLDGGWVRPAEGAKHTEFMIKIRGAFGTKSEAEEHAKELQGLDNSVDIYVVNMYEWLLLPPPPVSEMTNVKYTDERLQAIMDGYKENQKHAAQMFEKRKEDMTAKPSGSNMPFLEAGDENSKFYSKPDETPIPHPADLVEKYKEEHPDKSMEELVKMADDEVARLIKERDEERKKNLATVEEVTEEASGSGSSSKGKEKMDPEQMFSA
jgi:hypothetical protein